MESVHVQTQAICGPALPTAEQAAVLHWLGAAFQHWEEAFPLEEPLRLELRRVKPFAATLALLDSAFLTPGEHSLHRILDTLQFDAVGAQPAPGGISPGTSA